MQARCCCVCTGCGSQHHTTKQERRYKSVLLLRPVVNAPQTQVLQSSTGSPGCWGDSFEHRGLGQHRPLIRYDRASSTCAKSSAKGMVVSGSVNAVSRLPQLSRPP
jgi:hypothetical protein